MATSYPQVTEVNMQWKNLHTCCFIGFTILETEAKDLLSQFTYVNTHTLQHI
jgi:hypothetical protein